MHDCAIIETFRNQRRKGDPQTPNPHIECSKRAWAGIVRKWRRLLHTHDPEPTMSTSNTNDPVNIEKQKPDSSVATQQDIAKNQTEQSRSLDDSVLEDGELRDIIEQNLDAASDPSED